jgi:hypothetical protein
VISEKRPDVVRFASRGGSNRNGRSLNDLLKPTATGDRPEETPNLRLDRLSRIHTSFCDRASVRFSSGGLSRHARGEIVCTAVDGGAVRCGAAGDEVVGNDRIPR